MLMWSFIGAAYYLLRVITMVNSGFKGVDLSEAAALPDVDGALLVLVGVSQGSYIGDKLVSQDITKKPRLGEVKPAEGSAGTEVTLLGGNFGADQGQNFVDLDGVPVRQGLVWGNDQIQKVIIPADAEAGNQVAIRVYRDGEYSDDTLVFRVTEDGD
jgi:hypothetical protein